MEWMTRSSRHYCSAERWRDLKECISICQLSPPFAPSFTQPRQVNGPSGCSKTHSTKPTAESSPGCITLASYWLFCSQTTEWFEWVDGFSLTTGTWASRQIRAEHGGMWNIFYDLKELSLGFIFICIKSAWCIQDEENTVIYWAVLPRYREHGGERKKEQFYAVKSSLNTFTQCSWVKSYCMLLNSKELVSSYLSMCISGQEHTHR